MVDEDFNVLKDVPEIRQGYHESFITPLPGCDFAPNNFDTDADKYNGIYFGRKSPRDVGLLILMPLGQMPVARTFQRAMGVW